MRRLIAALVAAVVLTGCTAPDLSVLPAPDAVDGATYPLTVEFRDALNLPLGAKVKRAGAVIGEVTSIRTKDFRAYVEVDIARSVRLPVGTKAQIRFTTPLGEDYVALYPPASTTRGVIASGATIATTDTGAAPTIEDAFAALSLLLNGGGIDQIGTIVRELDKTLSGRTGTIRRVVDRMHEFVAALNSRRSDIDRALTGLHRLAVTLNSGDDIIDKALDRFPATLRILGSQTRQLTVLLQHVGRLGDVTADVLSRSTDTLLADLDLLRPTLRSLVKVRGTLAPTMRVLTRLGANIDAATPGDYVNANGSLSLIFNDTPLLPQASSPSATGSAAVRHLLVGSLTAVK